MRIALAAASLAFGAATPALANRESDALRARAAEYMYNLDRDLAVATYRLAIAADPLDAGAYRGLATGLWLSIMFGRGSMTVDDYLGGVPRQPASPSPAQPDAPAFDAALDRALTLGRKRVADSPRDADAHYQLGVAIGLRASYIATTEGRVLGAFRAAREAYAEHKRVLELDTRRNDAGLIVGTYRYLVSTLALPLRWMAYVAGFSGGKDHGLRLIEAAAGYPGDSQADARFALILVYNREKRYDDALAQLAVLGKRYPRNRLVLLETGSTYLRAGRAMDAERILDDAMMRFASDTRPRMFGEEALWHYKRGAARAALARDADARQDFTSALASAGRKWVHGRVHLELGKLALKTNNRLAARKELDAAIALCESDNDSVWADQARRLIR